MIDAALAALQVVVVGGGFSGTMAAIQLARLAAGRPVSVTVVNTGYQPACGVAYDTACMEHLVTLPAHMLSAFPDNLLHFVEWLQTQDRARDPEMQALEPDRLPEAFVSRRLYGRYLQSLMHEYVGELRVNGVTIRYLDGEAVDVEHVVPTGAHVVLRDGRRLPAHRIILATGNEAPAGPPGYSSAAVTGHPGWVANPWSDWLPHLAGTDRNRDVVLLGTGLTAVDIMLTLLRLDWRGSITALSRHALLPLPHFSAGERMEGTQDWPPAGVDLTGLRLQELLDLFSEHAARVTLAGGHPARLLGKIGPQVTPIWRNLNLADKQLFVSRYATRFKILRQQIAPSLHAELQQAVAQQKIRICRGSVLAVETDQKQLCVRIQDGPDPLRVRTLRADLVVNCLGPNVRMADTTSPILRQLLDKKLIEPDDMNMGIRVDTSLRALVNGDQVSPLVLAMGPLLRGTFWDSIALPHLRQQAVEVAQTILRQD
ncbi:FAD/NAD(P)-binding protein [Massilia sp. H6]|uniref:FAD/NAD(P)-binding protein n=1 Tax=Massilia sp. H6 TaxID=2970464 RepID=UPI002167F2B7|nr:FAD/NAD(P)-binding protein [Massilia sp. H6]UVW28154.1 FAD/NAD(P)-binding protein [Massilia sp. H6]